MSVYSEYIASQKAETRKKLFQVERKQVVKNSIQKKFLLFCVLLVVFMAAGISSVYFVMIRHDKQQQSQQHIQIAFDMLLNEIHGRIRTFSKGLEEFLKSSKAVRGAAYTHASQMANPQFSNHLHSIGLTYLLNVTDELKKFAHIVSANRIILYGADASVLALYQNTGGREAFGVSTISSAGNQTYLPLGDYAEANNLLSGREEIPDRLFPSGVPTHFYGEIPAGLQVKFFNEDSKLGIRIVAPVYQVGQEVVGVLVGDLFCTQEWIERYAALSQTEINLFIEDLYSIGTLPEQNELWSLAEETGTPVTIEEFLAAPLRHAVKAIPFSLKGENYYQGRYRFRDDHNTVYTFSAGISKTTEERAIRSVLFIILSISGLTIVVAFGLSVLLSRKSMRALHQIVDAIGHAASGNLRHYASTQSSDEFGLILRKLNEMIARLRDISIQTKAVSRNVSHAADGILNEVETLFLLTEEQSLSVDKTTNAVKGIDLFINHVVTDIQELLAVTEEVLSSLNEMSATTDEVAASTGYLNDNLHDISASSDQVSQASKQILQHVNQFSTTVLETEEAIRRIGRLLATVAENSKQSRELAYETADAAQQGQRAVESSIEGVVELKGIIERSAQIMHDVNSRSQQVSQIVDFVDAIAEKTALLSLNASIVSAQAGNSGRGFGVIAEEIRELSTQTKASTKEIHQVIRALQREARQGVKSVAAGLRKVDEGVLLANAARDSLDIIIQRAMQSSNRASHAVQEVQETVASSEVIQRSMNAVTTMTSEIQEEIQREEQNLQHVSTAIDNCLALSAQVTQANREQHIVSNRLAGQMDRLARHLGGISGQTHELQYSSDQILKAMQRIDRVSGKIRTDMTSMSEHTVNYLIRQAADLQVGLSVFKAE